MFAGGNDKYTALRIRKELTNILATAGIDLGKWAASDKSLLEGISDKDDPDFTIKLDEFVSILGLKCVPSHDQVSFEISTS